MTDQEINEAVKQFGDAAFKAGQENRAMLTAKLKERLAIADAYCEVSDRAYRANALLGFCQDPGSHEARAAWLKSREGS